MPRMWCWIWSQAPIFEITIQKVCKIFSLIIFTVLSAPPFASRWYGINNCCDPKLFLQFISKTLFTNCSQIRYCDAMIVVKFASNALAPSTALDCSCCVRMKLVMWSLITNMYWLPSLPFSSSTINQCDMWYQADCWHHPLSFSIWNLESSKLPSFD